MARAAGRGRGRQRAHWDARRPPFDERRGLEAPARLPPPVLRRFVAAGTDSAAPAASARPCGPCGRGPPLLLRLLPPPPLPFPLLFLLLLLLAASSGGTLFLDSHLAVPP